MSPHRAATDSRKGESGERDMAGSGQGAFIGALLAGAIIATTGALAEIVPLPIPAPMPKEMPGATGQPRAGAAGPTAGPAQPSGLRALFNWNRQPEPPATGSTSSAAFSSTQRAHVDKVSQYLSSVQQLSGNFVQVGPDGTKVRGDFYIQKPGKVRFEYDPPTPIEIIADGQSVVVRNSKLATQDVYPLSQTPLRFLLSDRIDLLRDTNVIGVRSDDVFVTVVIEEKQALIGTSRLMMMVGAKDFQLKQWTVTDPQGYDTTVAVSNLDSSKRPDASLFQIDYTRYNQ
jgi:outer membrane lipoprotein-sorting protein